MTGERAPATARAVEVTVPASEVDLASGLLWGADVTAVAEHPRPDGSVVLRADVPAGGTEGLRDALGGRWPVDVVEVDDGLDGWREHAVATRVGRVVVRPPWVGVAVARDEVEVVIDPGHAFGHGAHPTTGLCLEAVIEAVDAGARTVLDVGCGSGVLAVAAAGLGAAEVRAVDVDDAAVGATRANVAVNGVDDRVTVARVPATGWTPGRPCDLVVANIGAAVLRSLASDLVAAVAPDGVLVISGLLDPPPDDVAAAMAPLRVVHVGRRDGWSALTLRRDDRLPDPGRPAPRPLRRW